MPCLVLGGTGHIGNAFVRALLKQGHQVSITCRHGGERANLKGLKVAVEAGDDQRTDLIDRLVGAHELIVDAAAPYPLRLVDPVMSGKDQLRAALDRCRRLIDAVQRRDAHLIYVSSFTTLRQESAWFGRLQSATIRGSHPYFETKAAVEREVLNAAGQGLRAVIINPSVCFGPWDQKDPRTCFIAAVARGELWGVSDQLLNVIDVRDVADTALNALSNKCFGEPIPIAGHNVDLASLVREICRLVPCRPPIMRGSTRLAAVGAYWTDLMHGVLGQSPPIPSLPFLLLCVCRAMSPSPTQQKLGLRTRRLETTLADSLQWYRSIGYC